MNQLGIKTYIRLLYLALFILFILNKTLIRPWVLAHTDVGLLIITVNSFPNFCEAIMGSITLAGVGILIRRRFSKRFGGITDNQLFSGVLILAAIYVITQEFKLHNLGGRNVYDPFDVVASVMGLVLIYVLLNQYGMINRVEES